MQVRMPAVAGAFYPDDREALGAEVRRFLDAATPGGAAPEAIIAPHAGYRYSGVVAGSAYAPLRARAAEIRRVVLLGPAHRVGFRGIACSAADTFRTPLGDVT